MPARFGVLSGRWGKNEVVGKVPHLPSRTKSAWQVDEVRWGRKQKFYICTWAGDAEGLSKPEHYWTLLNTIEHY